VLLKEANPQELKALVDFIAYKERVLQHLQYVERNIQAIEDTRCLQKYLKEFPQIDKSEAIVGSFWLDKYVLPKKPTSFSLDVNKYVVFRTVD
jgi:hypothetical protein